VRLARRGRLVGRIRQKLRPEVAAGLLAAAGGLVAGALLLGVLAI
jgi:hypothetical protein